MADLNEIERGQICQSAVESYGSATGGLRHFPGLLKKIIRQRAWETRFARGKVLKLDSLTDLITKMPIEGWALTLDQVENVIKHDDEALVMFRNEIKGKAGNPTGSNQHVDQVGNSNNITNSCTPDRGTKKAYTLDRLCNQFPEIYAQYQQGKYKSANEAAIAAGFREKTISIPFDPHKAGLAIKRKYTAQQIDTLMAAMIS